MNTNEEYQLPPTRIRSGLEAFLDDGGTEARLRYTAEAEDYMYPQGKVKYPPGAIFRIRIPVPKNDRYPYLVYTLKLADLEFRFGHTIEELEHIRMLYGLSDA